VVPRGNEFDGSRDAGRGRRTPAKERLDPVEVVPSGDPRGQRAALVGPPIEGQLLAADLLRKVAARSHQLFDVLAAVAVAEQDGDRAARVLEQLVRGKLAHLGRRLALRVADVDRVRVAVQVHALGMDHDELRTPFADRLLDPEVDDRDVVLEVGGDDHDHARVIYLFDAHRWAGGRRDGGPAVHLHPGSLERAVEQLAEEESLLVGDVLRQRDAQLGALALDALGGGGNRVRPGCPGTSDARCPQSGRFVDVGVVEPAAVADPALVDVVVLMRGDADELAAALPLGHAAPDRALRADRRGVGHVPGPGFEPPDA